MLENCEDDDMKKITIVVFLLMVSFLLVSPVYARNDAGGADGAGAGNTIEATETNYVSCGSATGIPAPIPMLTSVGYTLLIVATPIILIIFSIVALVKAITAGNADEINKAKNKLIKKFITTAIVYFVAGIVQFVITKAADGSEKGTISSCLSCFLYHTDCAESQGPYEEAGLLDGSGDTGMGSSGPSLDMSDVTNDFPTSWGGCRYRNSSGDEYQLEFPNFMVLRHKESSGYVRVKPDSFKYVGGAGSYCKDTLKFTVNNGFVTISDGSGSGDNIYTKIR